MCGNRTSANCVRRARRSIILLFCLVLLASCGGVSGVTLPVGATKSVTAVRQVTATVTTMPTSGDTPLHFKARVLFQGKGRPDDLVFDQSESVLLFSDFYSGTISRILKLALGSHAPVVLRTIPGKPGQVECKHDIDGVAWDPSTESIIVPDSPTGDVYSLSLDGKTLKLLASGITRPVGATVDTQGNIYVADECGGAIWRIAPDGTKTRMGGFGMPDAVVIDPHGNLLIIDLQPAIHALIRMNMSTGKQGTY